MSELPDPFPPSHDPTVSYADALPTAALMEDYPGEWVIVRENGDGFDVIAHDRELEPTLASTDRREGDTSMYIPHPLEERY